MFPASLSSFETAWRACPAAHAMKPARCLRFDRSTGLLYSPLQHEYLAVEPAYEPPPPEWVRSALVEFVRGEFGSGSSRSEDPGSPPVQQIRTETVSRELPHLYL